MTKKLHEIECPAEFEAAFYGKHGLTPEEASKRMAPVPDPIRLYGVSHGNGNDGVSHIFANYYVRTNDPWRLAHLALIGEFKPEWQSKALAEADIDGDSNYTVTAVLYEPLDAEPGDEGYGTWCEANGAYRITEVFPEDKPRQGVALYESLEEAFTPDLLAKVPE